MVAPETFQTLIQIPICRGLTRDEVDTLFAIAEEASAGPGEVLFQEGAPGEALYVLLAGTVEIRKKDRAGTQQLLARIQEGGVFGEMSLVNGNAPRSASAVTAGAVRLLKLPAERFSRLLDESSLVALKVVHNLAQVMSRRLLLMDEKLMEVLDHGKRKEEFSNFQNILTHWAF